MQMHALALHAWAFTFQGLESSGLVMGLTH